MGVHLPAEHPLEFELANTGLERDRIALDLPGRGLVVLVFGQIEQLGGIVEGDAGAIELLELRTQARALLAELLGTFGRTPDSRILELAIDFL